MSVFHDEVEIEDFEYDPETETYYYPCPCGDQFEITRVWDQIDVTVGKNPKAIVSSSHLVCDTSLSPRPNKQCGIDIISSHAGRRRIWWLVMSTVSWCAIMASHKVSWPHTYFSTVRCGHNWKPTCILYSSTFSTY